MGGGGYVAGPGGAGGDADPHAAGPDRGRQPPRPRQPAAGRAGAAGLPRLPDRGPRRGAATWSPAGRCPRRCSRPTAARRGRASGSRRRARLRAGRRRQPGRALDQLRRGRGVRRARGPRLPASCTWPGRATTRSCASAWTPLRTRGLRADRVRAEPRRRPRRLRPGPGPLGRLDLRVHRRRPPGDPGPLSARDRRPPAGQRALDGAGGRGGRSSKTTRSTRRRCWPRSTALLGDEARLRADGGRGARAGEARRGRARSPTRSWRPPSAVAKWRSR